MATDPQIATTQRNALRSTGPSSPEGKAKPAQNAIKFGFHARNSVLSVESEEAYEAHLQSFIDRFLPADGVENSIVRRLADTDWRIQRVRYVEVATVQLQVEESAKVVDERYDSIQPQGRVAYSLQLLDQAQVATYANLQRAEARLHRQFREDCKLLAELQKNRRLAAAQENFWGKTNPISAAAAPDAAATPAQPAPAPTDAEAKQEEGEEP